MWLTGGVYAEAEWSGDDGARLMLFGADGNEVDRDYDEDGRASFWTWVSPGNYRLVLARWDASPIDYRVRLKFRLT